MIVGEGMRHTLPICGYYLVAVLEAMDGPKLVALDTMNLWIDITPDELRQVLAKVDVLLVNDDGIDSPGLAAVATVLAQDPTYRVTVVAPAAQQSGFGVFLVSSVFGVVTIATMMGMVWLLSSGLARMPLKAMERYTHAIAGGIIGAGLGAAGGGAPGGGRVLTGGATAGACGVRTTRITKLTHIITVS